MSNCTLRKLGHVEAEAKEVRVEDRREKRVLESEGPEDNTDKYEEFGIRNNAHRRIIIRYSHS